MEMVTNGVFYVTPCGASPSWVSFASEKSNTKTTIFSVSVPQMQITVTLKVQEVYTMNSFNTIPTFAVVSSAIVSMPTTLTNIRF